MSMEWLGLAAAVLLALAVVVLSVLLPHVEPRIERETPAVMEEKDGNH